MYDFVDEMHHWIMTKPKPNYACFWVVLTFKTNTKLSSHFSLDVNKKVCLVDPESAIKPLTKVQSP